MLSRGARSATASFQGQAITTKTLPPIEKLMIHFVEGIT